MSTLPFEPEPQRVRDELLDNILQRLYVAVRSEDYLTGVLYWSRQLQNWLALKFEMPRSVRARLVRMYYHLSLAPAIDSSVADRLVNMVIILTR